MPAFSVDYAKSDRSTCKGCGEKIAKDVLRIGIDGQFGPMWRHPACQEKKPKALASMRGFAAMDDAGQAELEAWFGAGEEPKKKRKASDAASEAKALEPKKMKVADLKALVASHGVELDDGVGKPELVALAAEVKTRAALEARYLALTNPELKQLLYANGQGRAGSKEQLVELCIDGKLHGRLPACPGVGGDGCYASLVFDPLPGKKIGHGGVGRYRCLGGYDTQCGYTRCPFKITGPCPAPRPPWKDIPAQELARLAKETRW